MSGMTGGFPDWSRSRSCSRRLFSSCRSLAAISRRRSKLLLSCFRLIACFWAEDVLSLSPDFEIFSPAGEEIVVSTRGSFMPPNLIFSLVSDSEDVSGPEEREDRCFFFPLDEVLEVEEIFRFPDSDRGEFLTEDE